MDKWTNGWIDR